MLANLIHALHKLFFRLTISAVEFLPVSVSEENMTALCERELQLNRTSGAAAHPNLRARALPRLIVQAVAATGSSLLRTRIVKRLLDAASRIERLDDAAGVKWPTEYDDYPATLRLLKLVGKPRLALGLVCYLLAAHRDGVLFGCYTGSGSFGEQSPSVYKRHRTAFMRWLRFVRECIIPTVFIQRDWTEAHGYMVEGYSLSIQLMLEGKSWRYVVGRRGQFLYEEPPQVDDGEPDDNLTPTMETCPTCEGSGMLGAQDELDGIIIRRGEEAKAVADGLELYDCDDCGGTGEIEVEPDDNVPDCFPVYGGGYSTTGY